MEFKKFSEVPNGTRFFVCENATLMRTDPPTYSHYEEHIKLYEETDDWNACELSTGCLAYFVETKYVGVKKKMSLNINII